MLVSEFLKSKNKLITILGTALVVIATALATSAQPNISMQDQGQAQASLDSLRRVITKQILSDAEKKAIRICEREKMEFLNTCRVSDSANAQITKQLNEAKMSSSSPNDPAIQLLLEKKFNLEKKCDEKYQALLKAKTCMAQEAKRQKVLELSLTKNKEYQALKKKAEAVGSEQL